MLLTSMGTLMFITSYLKLHDYNKYLVCYSNRILWIACSYHHDDVVLISPPDSRQFDTIEDEYLYPSISEFENTQMEVKQNGQPKKQAM